MFEKYRGSYVRKSPEQQAKKAAAIRAPVVIRQAARGLNAIGKERIRQCKLDAITLYLVCRDRRVPWYARAVALGAAGYVFSPIQLIPDWIPVIGYLDDIVVVMLGSILVLNITPKPVIDDCRTRAETLLDAGLPYNRTATICVIILWLALGAWLSCWLLHHHSGALHHK
jgi:uncharacterized membrane protein YkvA (DUF1232 family)